MILDDHGPGLKALPTHDPVVQDAANHAIKTIQQRSNSLVPYELKEIVHANAEVSSKQLFVFPCIFFFFFFNVVKGFNCFIVNGSDYLFDSVILNYILFV